MKAIIDDDMALDLLLDRLKVWTEDDVTTRLYKQMYESYIDSGCFEGMEFDVMVIVDNDYVNYCNVVSPEDDDYKALKQVYDEQGLGDCSCEDCNGNFIEAYDEATGCMLIRY